eukprot:CAMPEP_0184754768 /NCGR_PEP_ID=MMETSP0315-20130426/44794_1 /TAXON_ID=101924 /ORGANISM="Rhodosorus marinus, Strain UTEX LB 2760" /LENGTH=512 /DNA_ID=CAMNT_0027234203 /DNA_START=121 /DNA_END=1659 /DNA_ORIENTATION=-
MSLDEKQCGGDEVGEAGRSSRTEERQEAEEPAEERRDESWDPEFFVARGEEDEEEEDYVNENINAETILYQLGMIDMTAQPDIVLNNLRDMVIFIDGSIIRASLNRMPESSGPPPATREMIDAVEKRVYDGSMELMSESCVICHESYAADEEILYLPCKHEYHSNCVSTWLLKQNSCPICRRAIPPVPEASTEEKVEPSTSEVDAIEGRESAIRTSSRSTDQVEQMADQMASRMADQIADHMATQIAGQMATQNSRRNAEQMPGPSVVRRRTRRRTQTEAQTQRPELQSVRILQPLSSRASRCEAPQTPDGSSPVPPEAAMPPTTAQSGSTFSPEGVDSWRESSTWSRSHFRATGARSLANWIMDRRRQRRRRDGANVEGATLQARRTRRRMQSQSFFSPAPESGREPSASPGQMSTEGGLISATGIAGTTAFVAPLATAFETGRDRETEASRNSSERASDRTSDRVSERSGSSFSLVLPSSLRTARALMFISIRGTRADEEENEGLPRQAD